MRNVVGSPDVLKRFVAVVAPPDSLAHLVGGQFRLAPHCHATRSGAVPALAGAGADQCPLELCQPAKHGQHQASVRGRGVGPCVVKGTKPGSFAGDGRKRVEKIAG